MLHRAAVDLPYLTSDLPGIGGALRTVPEDFRVDEELPYPASGAGDHVFVRIEKRGLTTPHAVKGIARALGIQDRDIGVAGMKDRHAVTTQWLSLPPPVTPEQALALAVPDLTVLEAIRHNHKLRTGHVRSNTFKLVVRGVPSDAADRARAILERLARPPGAPNYYGEQRFGREGDNAERGRALLAGTAKRGDKKLDRLMVSALQSELFNAWLAARITDGQYATALAGDVLHKRGGGLFDCTEPDIDTPRVGTGEVTPTGPMFGPSMRRPADGSPAEAREAHVLGSAGLTLESFATVRALAEGTRRDAAIAVADVSVEAGADGTTVQVGFALPGGAYATSVMREVMKVS